MFFIPFSLYFRFPVITISLKIISHFLPKSQIKLNSLSSPKWAVTLVITSCKPEPFSGQYLLLLPCTYYTTFFSYLSRHNVVFPLSLSPPKFSPSKSHFKLNSFKNFRPPKCAFTLAITACKPKPFSGQYLSLLSYTYYPIFFRISLPTIPFPGYQFLSTTSLPRSL